MMDLPDAGEPSPDDSPLGGLFFLQDTDPREVARVKAGANTVSLGVAFLLDKSGLIATCAHVVMAAGGRPGQRLLVHSAVVPVSVEAEVTFDGWAGPEYGPTGFPQPVFFKANIDERPEVYKQDVALLRLDLTTARWHTGTSTSGTARTVRLADMTDSPLRVLREAWRVLPLGAASYRPGTPVVCWSWFVTWVIQQYELHPGRAEFYGCEKGRSQFDAILVRSDCIRTGFSGSPIWDPERQLVIGMVRRLLAPALPGLVRGTDAHFLIRHAKVARAVDARFKHLHDFIRSALQSYGGPRDFAQADWGDPRIFIEPRLRPAIPHDALGDEPRAPAFAAIAGLFQSLHQSVPILLQGAAGFGKTTLLHRLALECIAHRWEIGERPLVPLYLDASKLQAHDVDLLVLLENQIVRWGHSMHGTEITRCIEENDAAILLLIDGLDEIGSVAQKLVMQRLSAIAGQTPHLPARSHHSLVRHIIVATRMVNPETVDPQGKTREGFSVLELIAFEPSQVDLLATQLFPEVDTCKTFLTKLGDIGWNRDQPSPLQIRIAAEIFKVEGKLPERERGLTYHFIDRRLAHGSMVRSFQSPKQSDAAIRFYKPNLQWIAEFLAYAYRKKSQLSDNELRNELECLRTNGRIPAWLTDDGDFIRFLLGEVPGLTGLLWFTESAPGNAGPTVHWLHRTFPDALLARWSLRTTKRERSSVRSLFAAELGDAVEHNILGLLEDEAAYDCVKDILEQWLRDVPLTADKTSRKAIYALAGGIVAGGAMRLTLVKEMLRVVLTEFGNGSRCKQLFAVDDLPSPISIASRKELQVDICNAFRARLHVRIARASMGRPPITVTLNDREARLFDELGLWTSFTEYLKLAEKIDLELLDPRKKPDDGVQAPLHRDLHHEPGAPDPSTSAARLPGSLTRVTVRAPDGQVWPLEFDSRDFVDELVALGRQRPHLQSHELLAVFINQVLNVAQLPKNKNRQRQ